jgi:hypothetical protein
MSTRTVLAGFLVSGFMAEPVWGASREVSTGAPRAARVRGRCCRRRVDAAVWTAIGLIATFVIGSLFFLGSRIDASSGRIDSLAGRIDARFAQIDGRFDRVDARFDRIDGRFVAVEARLDALSGRIDAHADRHAG